MRPIDITGQKFGRLSVIELAEKRPNCKIYACLCDCGQTKKVRMGNLRSGHIKSCGCLNSELSAARQLKHGRRHTPEYQAWAGAKQRCTNPNVERYPEYGGRGIRFLFTSFEQFFAELGEKPFPKNKYSIDRKNPNGNYEPGNVRWATAVQQRNNQRRSIQ